MLNWSDRVPLGGRSLQVRDIAVAIKAFGHETLICDCRSLSGLRGCLAWRPELLHVHGGITPALGALMRIMRHRAGKMPPMVCTLHGWHHRGVADALERSLERLGMHACARITLPNNGMLVELPTALRGRATVIPNGVHPVQFGQQRDMAHIDVMWLGRVSEAKGIGVALAAFAEAAGTSSDLRLHVVGAAEEPSMASLLSKAEAQGAGNVRYHGSLDHPWDGIQPSILLHTPHYDAFPRVVLEAMSADVAVVATAVGGIPEMVVDGASGLLAPDGDARLLAAHLVALASDTSLRQRLACSARARFSANYTIGLMSRRIEAVYREVAGW